MEPHSEAGRDWEGVSPRRASGPFWWPREAYEDLVMSSKKSVGMFVGVTGSIYLPPALFCLGHCQPLDLARVWLESSES